MAQEGFSVLPVLAIPLLPGASRGNPGDTADGILLSIRSNTAHPTLVIWLAGKCRGRYPDAGQAAPAVFLMMETGPGAQVARPRHRRGRKYPAAGGTSYSNGEGLFGAGPILLNGSAGPENAMSRRATRAWQALLLRLNPHNQEEIYPGMQKTGPGPIILLGGLGARHRGPSDVHV